MSQDDVDLFLEMEGILTKEKKRSHLRIVVSEDALNEIDAEIKKEDEQRAKQIMAPLEEYFNPFLDPCVSLEEARELLDLLIKSFDDEKVDNLISECKNEVLSNIIKPFGLGKVLFQNKNGGNVTTIHNARQGVYAREEEEEAYKNRGEYNPDEYHRHPTYIAVNREHSEKQNSGQLIDGYTGEKIGYRDHRDLDHNISAYEIHKDRGRVLAGMDGPDLANRESNLFSTDRSINRSKGGKPTEQFLNGLKSSVPDRQRKTEELLRKQELNEKERKKLKKLTSLESVDAGKMSQIDISARNDYNDELNKYYRSKKFLGQVGTTGLVEGGRMALQQALGLALHEFITSIFDEIKDIYQNGFKGDKPDEKFWQAIRFRFDKVKTRIIDKWDSALDAAKSGFFSGFVSNLVTIIINMFVRTGKNVVRMIREGFFSLLRAFKTLLFPPEGLTFSEAAHEASKLVASGIIISGGIIFEEFVQKSVLAIPVLAPLAGPITAILVGTVTGLATVLASYLLDKIDLFGVNETKRQDYIIEHLNARFKLIAEETEALISEPLFYFS